MKINQISIFLKRLKLIFLNILIVLVLYFLCRIIFLIFNYDLLFSEEKNGFLYWLNLFYGSLKFDISAITIINIPFIFLSILPFKFRNHKIYYKINTILFFYIFNTIGVIFNMIDIAYSSFTKKRMTFDVFNFMKAEGGFFDLIPSFFKDFWFLVILFLLITTVFILISEKINKKFQNENIRDKNLLFFTKNIAQFVICCLLCFIAIRGNFGIKPLSIISASKYAKPAHYSLVLNTPFTIIKSAFKEQLQKKNYFSPYELKEIYNPIYLGNTINGKHTNYNVVVIILESFSMEYSAILNQKLEKSDIPHFDSIAKLGQIIPTISNSVTSMEGNAAIVAGIPTLMTCDYISSIYSGNHTTTLASVLKKRGYKTAFFHGGKNG